MVVFFVHPETKNQHHGDIQKHQKMKPSTWDRAVNDNFSEVADEQVHRIEQEKVLCCGTVAVDAIEDGGHIHQKLHENCPKILDVPEKHKQGRQNQTYTEVKQSQTKNRIQKQDEFPRKSDTVKGTKQEKNEQG